MNAICYRPIDLSYKPSIRNTSHAQMLRYYPKQTLSVNDITKNSAAKFQV